MRPLRLLGLLPLLLLTGAGSPGLDQINESGRVMAQLDDMRAIYFVLIVVIGIMVLIIGAMMRQNATTQKILITNLTTAVGKLAESLDGMTRAQTAKTTADLVNDAHIQAVMGRTDATMTRVERMLDQIDITKWRPGTRKLHPPVES